MKLFWVGIGIALLSACASGPDIKHEKHEFPLGDAFVGEVKRPYKTLGVVKAKLEFTSFDIKMEDDELCRNYYNRAVRDLVTKSKSMGADAVVDVKSVVFLLDGRREQHPTPECSDDGSEGQIIVQGVAAKWSEPDIGSENPGRTSPGPVRKKRSRSGS